MRRGLLLFFVAAAVLMSTPAKASLIISVTSVSAAAGSSGSFDVDIQNTGTTQNIAAFTFALSVAGGSGITFTGANESTALTYIFNGDSFDIINSSPLSNVPPAAASLEANDLSNSGSGNNMGTTTLGLGHILFSVASNAATGPVTVTLTPNCPNPNNCTSLSNSAGASLPFTVSNGTITITPGTGTPEPSTLLLSLLALPVLALRRK